MAFTNKIKGNDKLNKKEVNNNNNGDVNLYESGAHFKYTDLYNRLQKIAGKNNNSNNNNNNSNYKPKSFGQEVELLNQIKDSIIQRKNYSERNIDVSKNFYVSNQLMNSKNNRNLKSLTNNMTNNINDTNLNNINKFDINKNSGKFTNKPQLKALVLPSIGNITNSFETATSTAKEKKFKKINFDSKPGVFKSKNDNLNLNDQTSSGGISLRNNVIYENQSSIAMPNSKLSMNGFSRDSSQYNLYNQLGKMNKEAIKDIKKIKASKFNKGITFKVSIFSIILIIR